MRLLILISIMTSSVFASCNLQDWKTISNELLTDNEGSRGIVKQAKFCEKLLLNEDCLRSLVKKHQKSEYGFFNMSVGICAGLEEIL